MITQYQTSYFSLPNGKPFYILNFSGHLMQDEPIVEPIYSPAYFWCKSAVNNVDSILLSFGTQDYTQNIPALSKTLSISGVPSGIAPYIDCHFTTGTDYVGNPFNAMATLTVVETSTSTQTLANSYYATSTSVVPQNTDYNQSFLLLIVIILIFLFVWGMFFNFITKKPKI